MESPGTYPESPFDPEEAAFPCKGCGEILEEGKAFELAGNRWHIDCFRCNTCGTLLDGDANLLLLGDGSLICNNCTYSCSNCGNKIEDLAILTGDQAFCANCFKCRNCKKKIENLRYARTSQGIFCMECHEALMARRRKKTSRNAAQRQKLANANSHLDKSLPSLPPSEAHKHAFTPSSDSPPSSSYSSNVGEAPSLAKQVEEMRKASERHEQYPLSSSTNRDNLGIPSASFTEPRHSLLSQRSDQSGPEEFLVPMAFDPNPPSAPIQPSQRLPRDSSRDQSSTSRSENIRPRDTMQSLELSSTAIGYQEKERKGSHDNKETSSKREDSIARPTSTNTSPHIGESYSSRVTEDRPRPQIARAGSSPLEKFHLQEAPKKRLSGSNRDSGSQATTPRPEQLISSAGHSALSTPVVEGSEGMYGHEAADPDYSPEPSTESPNPMHRQHLQELPKRGDSLESSKRTKTIPRKELRASANIPQLFSDLTHGPSTQSTDTSDLSRLNGGKVISKPIESPASKSILDTPNAQPRLGSTGEDSQESFVAPRAPPLPPTERTRNESMSGMVDANKLSEPQQSPALPRWSAGGEFNMEEDMARILGLDEAGGSDSFLRRFSNSVRHGRSYSDKTTRMSRDRDRWPRSPVSNNLLSGQEISSPSTASPENRDELSWFKNELRRERQKNTERERRIAELEATLDSTADIKQVTADLREKRSTMVVLDAQKEIVVKELEVLTEHIAAVKKSGGTIDVKMMGNTILRDFAESLQKLKESFSPQIEEMVQKRNELFDEISNLTQMKDKNFQEFEQLSSKNAQLADLNNQLVHQIQGLYKANAGITPEVTRPPQTTNGLGIYSHHKEKSQMSFDSRAATETSMPGSGTTYLPEEHEAAAAVIQGPHMVNIRKGQAKKFNWRKEGRNVAKGVKQGLKGAFSSGPQQGGGPRDMQYAEGGLYDQGPMGQEYSTLPRNNQEPIKGGFGLFGNNQKMPPKVNGLFKQANSSMVSLDASTHLYGSDLEQRAEFEKTSIPSVVTRCIEEVEARGMDVEGIYRKSGGNSQVQAVRDAFERNSPDFDLADPDLDIHAVTSSLKQYLRKLPNPLITYDVYDLLLETPGVVDDDGDSNHNANGGTNNSTARLEAVRESLRELPKCHYDVLEHLMRHLERVVAREKENLMSSMNVAVVFAPTIMRPESLGRELTDTKAKNEVVMWLVENVQAVFG